jgi:hypothetical protein
MDPGERLQAMLRRFVDGEDTSQLFVEQIEALVTEHFLETEIYDELSLPLACYSGGRGVAEEGLYNEAQLAAEFRFVLRRLFRGEAEDRPPS